MKAKPRQKGPHHTSPCFCGAVSLPGDGVGQVRTPKGESERHTASTPGWPSTVCPDRAAQGQSRSGIWSTCDGRHAMPNFDFHPPLSVCRLRKATHYVQHVKAIMAEGQTNGTKARDIEFFGGASRFELELEVGT